LKNVIDNEKLKCLFEDWIFIIKYVK
jgi:hypothetical protein